MTVYRLNASPKGRECARRTAAVLSLLVMVALSPSWAQAAGTLAAVPRLEANPADAECPVVDGRQSLQQLIAFALAHNPEVSATAFDGQAAEARTRAAKSVRLPRFSVEGGYTVYGDDLRLIAARYNGELGVFGNNILSADLVLRLPLFTGGRLSAEIRAADLLEASAGQLLVRSKADLAFNISSLYYSLLAQMRLIDSLTFTAGTLDFQLKRVNALIDARKAAKVDALRTEVKLADIRQRLLREQNGFAVQRQALLNLMGAAGCGADFRLEGELVTPPAESKSLAEAIETALSRRPDAIAARTEVEAQAARVAAASAGHWPTVNLVGAVGRRVMYDPTQEPRGQNSNEDASRIGITFEIPVFEGGRISARIDEENAKLFAQRRRLNKLGLQIRLEVEIAHANLVSGLERLLATETTVALADESQRIEGEKYALGRGTLLDVLDAQSSLLDAQATRIRALADSNTAAAQLAWATGENLP